MKYKVFGECAYTFIRIWKLFLEYKNMYMYKDLRENSGWYEYCMKLSYGAEQLSTSS